MHDGLAAEDGHAVHELLHPGVGHAEVVELHARRAQRVDTFGQGGARGAVEHLIGEVLGELQLLGVPAAEHGLAHGAAHVTGDGALAEGICGGAAAHEHGEGEQRRRQK